MKKFRLFYSYMSLALLFAVFASNASFAQGNQPNSNTLNQSAVKQAAPSAEIQNEEAPLPWEGYKGISNIENAKQAWVSEHQNQYAKLLPTSLTVAPQAVIQSADELDIVSDAVPVTYGNKTASDLAQAGSVNVGLVSGKMAATYSFTATSSFTQISTCNAGTNFDTYLTVYSVSNGAAIEVASNDDACGLNSMVNLPTVIGQQYVVVVNGYNNSIGNVVVEIVAAVAPISNPPFGQPCPLRLVLVLDESGSINSTEADFVRNGVNAFVAGLKNTGTQMAIVEFSDVATAVTIGSSSGLQTVDDNYQAGVSSYLNSGYSPLGVTNWAAAFNEVYALNPDLVIFFTDGVPNRPIPSSSSLDAAVTAANAVKLQGTRIFMLGVGFVSPTALNNLQAVSGPNLVNPPSVPFIAADYGLEADFSTIQNSLTALSTAFLTNYYADNDGDGFGAGSATNACDAPGTNYVTNNLDCDDLDPNVYPGASEICDGKDNDCSGAIDDADGDGVEDLCDNCPDDFNPGQEDSDGNGEGDVCDPIAATALHFDGANDKVEMNGLNLTGPLTIEAWIKPNSKFDFLTMLSNKFGGFGSSGFIFAVNEFQTSNGNLVFETSGAAVISTTPVSWGVWQHVAFTYDGTDGKMFINGTEVNTSLVGSGVNLLASAEKTYIGTIAVYNANSHFSGDMDELRIWNKALCESEIQAKLNCELTGSESGLVAYYNFNQGVVGADNSTVTTLNDITGNGSSGTLQDFALNGYTSNWSYGVSNGVSGTCSAIADADSDGISDLCDACPNDPYNDIDGDGICGDVDNCVSVANPLQEDSDCDGVGDVCDLCPGGDDMVDNNADGLPDCAYPPAYADIDASWKCANNKVYMCHIDDDGNRMTLCVSKNAINGHMSHGDFLGPCNGADCNGAKTSWNAVEDDLHMHVYPIPAEGFIYADVYAHATTEAQVTITDYLGRTVFYQTVELTSGESTIEINTSGLESGMYMLRIATNDISQAVKIIIQ